MCTLISLAVVAAAPLKIQALELRPLQLKWPLAQLAEHRRNEERGFGDRSEAETRTDGRAGW